MKKLYLIILAAFLLQLNVFAQSVWTGQESGNFPNDTRPDWSKVQHVVSHDRNFQKNLALSFYKRKSEWQYIIDTTWGPGLPLASKLQIFDSYAKELTEKFDGFMSLGISWTSWDSIKTAFRSRINDSTSRGAFAAIMSHFAWRLRDGHTWALDLVVTNTPLNPGVPLLNTGLMSTAEHFGAVLTALPDSTALVLRTVQNHPLSLEPGDIVLGYEGVPWKQLVKELMDAWLPINSSGVGAASAEIHSLIRNVGNNWHFFDTIDVLRHSKGDTVHLSIQPLLNLPPDPMMGNEQLTIPGIPSAQWFYSAPSNPVFYGVIPGTSIGYIQMFAQLPPDLASQHLYDAINTLWKTQGLIIDLRWNGGYWEVHEFDSFFSRIFNQRILPIEDVYRVNSTSFDLMTVDTRYFYEIAGTPDSIYDRPIAVLLGPPCVSGGDIMAWLLHFHPMARTFGKPTFATLGDNLAIPLADWDLHYSISDPFLTSQPGQFLNRSEFPIDEPVWHNPDDVAIGKDAIVEKALDWINNLVYGHSLTKNSTYCNPGIDTLKISAMIGNPNSHQISSKVYIENLQGNFTDSLELNEAGERWTGNYIVPDFEGIFKLSLSAIDISDSKTFTTDNISRFSTAGPVLLDSLDITYVSGSKYYKVIPYLYNQGTSSAITTVSVKLICNDPWITSISPEARTLADISPGSTMKPSGSFSVRYDESLFPGYFNFKVEIMSDGWTYWEDSVKAVVTGVEREDLLPLTYKLEQNYPNPFNPSTSIQYQIPQDGLVTLKVYDILGREIATLVNEEKPAGTYEVTWNAEGLASSVYYYQLSAGGFVATKKLLLLK